MKDRHQYCSGDWRPFTILLLIITIPIVIWCSSASFVLGWVYQFGDGYESGYNDIQDTLQTRINCNLRYDLWYYDYTEGIFDWWENPFWYQQGYEEGVKRGARDYTANNIYHFRVDLSLSGLTDNGSFEWTKEEVKSELLECFEDFAMKIEVKQGNYK